MRIRGLLVAAVVGASGLVVPAGPASPAAAQVTARGCDPVDPADCLMPFPNDWFTVADRSTATGRRVAFRAAAMPRNRLGKAIDPAEWNRSDGFSPGSPVLTRVPGVDLARSGAAPITDIGRSLAADSPIVIIDTTTGRRWPHWAELDAQATRPDRQALIIRPARNFLEGHRYVVALRRLKDGRGATIPAGRAFARIKGRTLPKGDPLHARQRHARRALADLARHGIGTGDLYLAWDFTVASRRSLSERMLRIRDDSFAGLGDRAPRFVVTEVTDNPPEDRTARTVKGRILVPSYLNLPGGPPGSGFHYGRDGLPARLPGNTQAPTFQCTIPRAAFTRPARPALYGHGLLGAESEVGAGNVRDMADEHGFLFCATKWAGMSRDDVPNVVTVLADLSRFSTVADRLQQGMLNMLWLGRAMIHDRGLAAHRAFRTPDGRPLIDTGAGLVFDGNSQGGIMGGALTAVSTDVRRAVLGVPAMNYSTLLNRSVDFDQYSVVLNAAYPDKLDQQLCFALIQMLWDRGEANGYAQHMTDRPLPGTPSHRVLMHVAFGDHQVSPTAAEVEARTIGARLHTPAVAPGRNPDRVPYWGIPAIGGYPYRGSALVIWDSGTPYQPLTNTPPSGPQYGRDPHADPRNSADARRQKAIFLETGEVVDVCAGAPCTAPARE
ncbi:hypothetical protein SAMN04489712_105325 [Thermomonospora echinospora]|uniref:ATP-dependent DNA helicase RecG n=1 Tax=Thermomonospora echinospora TaxID=1992 RepID=A0A1H6AAP6_9ACTN|nr:hypothetical protein [Thermomonospora echinospora]SEG45813.1 hypothetical protein SAMN04489712_105325 [Thermomonospora echinospora]